MSGPQSATRPPPSRSHPIVPRFKPPKEIPPVSLHRELAQQLEGLPSDLGVTLLVLGLFGVAIPGPIPPGFSFILMGIIVLRPGLIEQSGAPLARRFPRIFRVLVGLVSRFRLDLARRYPGSVPQGTAIQPTHPESRIRKPSHSS